MEKAKEAVLKFVETFNIEKDSIAIIGFSSTVDKVLPLTNDRKKIHRTVKSMNAEESTAFYDGVVKGIESLKDKKGIRVVIALTDGMDNMSKNTPATIADKAAQYDIPVYVVGLGNVDSQTLSRIAQSCKGEYFYARSSRSLVNIYDKISRKIQAVYEMNYVSPNLSSTDTARDIEISFSIDSLYLDESSMKIELPDEVLSRLREREEELQKQQEIEEAKLKAMEDEQKSNFFIYGVSALVTVAAAGTIVYAIRKGRRKETGPSIVKCYPNPTTGIFNVDYLLPSDGVSELILTDLEGRQSKIFNVQGTTGTFDITGMQAGTYLVTIRSGSKASVSEKIILH